MADQISQRRNFARPASDELKRKSVRGGFVVVAAQGAKVLLQTGTLILLARLLTPEDFGLTGMVATLTGFLTMFRDAGLSAATVQRLEVTHEQISTLFWINVAFGAVLSACAILLAPAVARFYGDPRLYWITIVAGTVFLFNGLSAQHGALISRQMRFATQARIDLTALAASSAVGVVMAFLGWRYWSLVGMGLVSAILTAAGVLLAVPWAPGPPRRGAGVRSILRFGGLATCNSFLIYLSWNAQNILLGRFWGAHVLGLYGRAFQLATLPVEQFSSTLSVVAISGLSAIQDDANRLSRSFLRGYSLLVSATIPIAIACPLFADEIIHVLLGERWMDGGPDLPIAGSDIAGFRLGESALMVGYGDGPGWSCGQHHRGDHASGDCRHPAGTEPRTDRGRDGILGRNGADNNPDYGLVKAWDRNCLVGPLERDQKTLFGRIAGGRDRFWREILLRRWSGSNSGFGAGSWNCLQRLRLRSCCDGPEKNVLGSPG